jgi:hypothetical protein
MTLTPASIRLDLKCGKGAISEGEKCTKGPASVTKRKSYPRATKKEKLLKKVGMITSIGGAVQTLGGVMTGKVGHAYGGFSTMQAGRAISNYGEAMEAQRKGQKSKAKMQRARAALNLVGAGLSGAAAHAEGKRWVNFKKTQEAERQQYERAARASEYARQKRAEYSNWGQNRNSTSSGSGNSRRSRPNTSVKNPFSDLGVPENASDSDIKKRWLKLMRENHPDAGGDPEKAKNINAAYQEIMRRRGRRDSIYADGFDIDWAAIAI